jgi:hypothetical protein
MSAHVIPAVDVSSEMGRGSILHAGVGEIHSPCEIEALYFKAALYMQVPSRLVHCAYWSQ